MGKNNKNRITCPHCGKDITEYVNRVTAGRAGRVSGLKRPKEYYRDLINKRWDKERAAKGQQSQGTEGKDDISPSGPQKNDLRRG